MAQNWDYAELSKAAKAAGGCAAGRQGAEHRCGSVRYGGPPAQ